MRATVKKGQDIKNPSDTIINPLTSCQNSEKRRLKKASPTGSHIHFIQFVNS